MVKKSAKTTNYDFWINENIFIYVEAVEFFFLVNKAMMFSLKLKLGLLFVIRLMLSVLK
jgi:hypothetical protein